MGSKFTTHLFFTHQYIHLCPSQPPSLLCLFIFYFLYFSFIFISFVNSIQIFFFCFLFFFFFNFTLFFCALLSYNMMSKGSQKVNLLWRFSVAFHYTNNEKKSKNRTFFSVLLWFISNKDIKENITKFSLLKCKKFSVYFAKFYRDLIWYISRTVYFHFNFFSL